MSVFNESVAMVRGLTALSYNMKGKETWLIIILTFLFSFAGASYGMAEETLVFYPVIVPLFLAAGYDLLVPVAVIYAGAQIGYSGIVYKSLLYYHRIQCCRCKLGRRTG